MTTVESKSTEKAAASSTWPVTLVLLVGLLLATSALLYKMTLGAETPEASTFTEFEAYLHQRGCVVAQIFNTSVTSYRCDVPVPGAYLSSAQLRADFRRSQSAKP